MIHLIFKEENVCSVTQQILLVERLPHVSDWIFGGGEQNQTSGLLSGSLCSIKGDGQSILSAKNIVLKEVKQMNLT